MPKFYQYATPQVRQQITRAAVRRLIVDYQNDRVVIEVAFLEGASFLVQMEATFTVNNFNAFVANQDAFPGADFVEKILNLLSTPTGGNILPPGGSIVEE